MQYSPSHFKQVKQEFTWPQLFKGCIALSSGYSVVCFADTYPLGSVILSLNNRALAFTASSRDESAILAPRAGLKGKFAFEQFRFFKRYPSWLALNGVLELRNWADQLTGKIQLLSTDYFLPC